MSTHSVQQYIRAQADFYYTQGCINQKQEVVASPLYMSFYKNKTEEQILYEHLKEKRGPSKKYNDTVLTPSSILERERIELLSKGQSDRSFNSMDEPSGYPREPKMIQSREIRPPIVNIEAKQSNNFNRRDKEDYEDRDSFLNSRPIEKIEVEASPIIKPESERFPSEDNKQKKGPSLKDKLLAKKKEMETSKIVKPDVEPDSGSIPKSNPSISSLQESRKVDINDEPQDSEEISSRNRSIIRGDQIGERIQKQTIQRKEEEIPNKMDLSNLTLNSDLGDVSGGDYVRSKYIEEPKSLINRVSDLSQQQHRSEEGKLKRISEQEHQREEEIYYKPRQEAQRAVNLMEDDEELPLQRTKEAPENFVDRDFKEGESKFENSRQKISPLRQEPQRRMEQDYVADERNINYGDSMKQSQASKSSGQRRREEQEFDESEQEQPASYYHEQMRKSKGMESKPKEAEYQYQKRDYINAEDTRMVTSSYINQKDQGCHEGYRVRQQEAILDKPARSETSIAESNEKKMEKSEKTGSRPVVSYLKSIEEMLMKIMTKQDALEENQKKMMQIQRRQEEEIEAIRRQLEGEE